MTLEQFTILRKEELVVFFKARFGKHWRQIVARQTNLHPRAFQRWKGAHALPHHPLVLPIWVTRMEGMPT